MLTLKIKLSLQDNFFPYFTPRKFPTHGIFLGIMKDVNTFFVRTYGCQMNELDSEIMVGQLEKRGLTRTQEEDLADLLIFNTC